jgi:hypothetical protein
VLGPFFVYMLTFCDNALKHGPWSQSKLDVASQCGLRFHLKYIQKKKEPVPVRPEGRIGAAAHKAIELVLKGEKIERAMRVGAVDNKLTTNELDDLYIFQPIIAQFVERIKKFEEKNPVEHRQVEFQFGLTKDLKPTGFFGKDVFFRGVYDLNLATVTKSLIIVDHKSGQPKDDISHYDTQLKFYALAGRVLYPSINGVQSAIHWLRTGDMVWGKYTSTEEIDDTYVKWFEEYINNAVTNLSDEPRKGWYCGFCGFTSQCPLFPGG